MRRFLAVLLVFSLVMGGVVLFPAQVFANQGHDKKIPPGQAKKFSLDFGKLWEKEWDKNWDDLFAELEQHFDQELDKADNIKFLTRSQVAFILAERSAEFANFDNEQEILAKVVDKGAIHAKYRKAVAYVISEELMTYKQLPNGRINFQPNKAAAFSDLIGLSDVGAGNNNQNSSQFSGIVRFIYTIGSKTWLAVETSDAILRTAYFPVGSVPSSLEIGTHISVKLQGYKIMESNLSTDLDDYRMLTLSLKTTPTTPRVNHDVRFTPQLTNNSSQHINLQNVMYRFGIKKVGTSTETLFTGSDTQTVVVPAKNSSNPVNLVVPVKEWTPTSAGNYLITRAEIRVNNGEWQEIAYQQSSHTVNLLNANQSDIESSTSGFSPTGQNTYAGATLKRDTDEEWQGHSSLRVLTNGISPWQGVNVVYDDDELSGKLTYSFYVKAPSGVPLRVKIFDNTNDTYPSGGTLEFTGTGYWERELVTFTPTDSTSELSLQVTLNNDNSSIAYWLDGLQLEQGSSATGWTIGGTQTGLLTVIE